MFLAFGVLAFQSPAIYIGPFALYLSMTFSSCLYASSLSSSGLSAWGMYTHIIVIGSVLFSLIYINLSVIGFMSKACFARLSCSTIATPCVHSGLAISPLEYHVCVVLDSLVFCFASVSCKQCII